MVFDPKIQRGATLSETVTENCTAHLLYLYTSTVTIKYQVAPVCSFTDCILLHFFKRIWMISSLLNNFLVFTIYFSFTILFTETYSELLCDNPLL